MQRNQFGTFGGVFTPCILTILGVIMFMRANFVVGQAGVVGAVGILCLSVAITFLTALSTSAIGTNMRVRGGGAYFLVSRVLGLQYGAPIGVVLFLALSVSVPFYVLGFAEALVHTFPGLKPHEFPIGLATAGILFVVTYVGAGWAIKVQYLIMAVLAGAVVSFLAGAALLFSPERLAENLGAGYTAPPGGGEAYSFWVVFAVYFPAVTGIMAGINMSGDLKNPGRSIPRGTLAAIAVGVTVYLLQIVLSAGAFERAALIDAPYLTLRDNALFGRGWLIGGGVLAATFSSALGSFMGAPRVLQALSRDQVFPVLGPFARGSAKADEPRRALWIAGALTFAVLLWANSAGEGQALNLVAGVITEFFLCTYGMLNFSAFIEALGNNPSFRPEFRYFHWSTALAGTLGCAAVAFIISPVQAAVAVLLLSALFAYVRRCDLRASHGNAWRGFLYNNLRKDLLRLTEVPEDPKNWRPTCLVFSGNPDTRGAWVDYGVWFEADRGLVFLAQLITGPLEDALPRRQAAFERLQAFCRKRDMQAFPVVVVNESLESGMAAIIQSLNLGPLRPNLAIFGWAQAEGQARAVLPGLFRVAHNLGMAICVVRAAEQPPNPGPSRIDIWWRGMENGGLMLLLAHLMRQNWLWEEARIRLLRVIPNEAGRESTHEDLEALLSTARVQAEPQVIVAQRPFVDILREQSGEADCVFLGFALPEEGAEEEWGERSQALVEVGCTTVLVAAAGQVDLLA